MATTTDTIVKQGAEKRIRRQWKSFNIDRSTSIPNDQPSHQGGESPILDDFFSSANLPHVGEGYGEVIPVLKSQLAEQGDLQSQLELSRDILIKTASDDLTEEEKTELEEEAMYWLLRASEQGSEEAVDTLTSMAVCGRGVTDHNYVDIVNITSVPKHITQANFIAKKLFKTLSKGNNFLTTVQLSRLVNDNTKVPKQPVKNAKSSQEDMIDNCCQYMEGYLPSLDQSLHTITYDYSVVDIITSNYTIMLCVFVLQCMSSPSLISTSSVIPTLLLAATLHTRDLKKKDKRYKIWSNIFSLFSDTLCTEQSERRYSSKQCITPFLIFHSISLLQSLLFTDMVLQPCPSLYLVLAISTLASISVVHLSSAYLVFLLGNLLLTFQASYLVNLLSPYIPVTYCSTGTILLAWQVGYLTTAILLKTGREVQAELQAFFWEDLSLRVILTGGGAISLTTWNTPLVTACLGLVSLCCLAVRYKTCRTSCLVLCLALMLTTVLTTTQARQGRVISQLSWTDYEASCLSDKLTAGDQATCHHFTGLTVEWAGVVEKVRIMQRRNYMEEMISLIPEAVRQRTDIKCLLGDEFVSCESKRSTLASLLCKTRTQPDLAREERCHLERFAVYEYQIALTMPAPLFGTSRTVLLTAGDHLRNTVVNIREGQKVKAVGKLVSWIGGDEVKIEAQDIIEDLAK